MNQTHRLLLALACATPLSAWAAHPLTTDDPGTQGDGGWQYELNTERAARQADVGRAWTLGTALTRGIGERTDVYLGLPYTLLSSKPAGTSAGSGFGDTETGIKYRFYEDGPYQLAVRTFVTWPTGAESRGLGTGRLGAGAVLIGQVQLGALSWIGNLGQSWTPNRQGDRSSVWQASSAVLYRLAPAWQLVGEIGLQRNGTPGGTAPAHVLAGAIWSPSKTVDLDLGYRRGLNQATYRQSLMAGMTLHW